ncbi:hypothetical protein O3M35_012827 [Rhynocoris fuscipes]|uniref:Uncharacterized protein n=1 Tax=Rhynocoris fuscipes TaxID=488301 RepID=A0AAW1CKQ5_9HEMI
MMEAKDVSSSLLKETDESSSDEDDIVAPSELVQIVAPYQEVKCWISSFIEEKRNQINLHNVQDFCVDPELRQNCARVDAVLVKRKGTTSHITVKDIKNYYGPQDQFDKLETPAQTDKISSNKKVYTTDEIEQKIKNLNNFQCQSPSSNIT